MRTCLAKKTEVGSATILATLAGAAISAIVLSGMVQMMDLGFRSGKHIELKDDVNSIRRTILQSLDCSQTLATGNRVGETIPGTVDKASGPDCDPTAPDHKLLLLKDVNGNSITTSLETAVGPFQNSGKIGAWQIRTQCDRSSRTLIVRAARRSSEGGFSRDPLSKRAYDYEGNSLYLFGGPGTPICQAALGGADTTPSCPLGQPIIGIDFQSQTVRCDASVISCHWYSHGTLVDNPLTQGCQWNVLDSDDCNCPYATVFRGSDIYTCPGQPYNYNRCLCCNR